MGAQLGQLFAIRPVHGNTAALSDKPDNFIAWNRLATARDLNQQITHALHGEF